MVPKCCLYCCCLGFCPSISYLQKYLKENMPADWLIIILCFFNSIEIIMENVFYFLTG